MGAVADSNQVVYAKGDVPQLPLQLGQLLVDSTKVASGATNLQQCTSQVPLAYEGIQGSFPRDAAEIAAAVTPTSTKIPSDVQVGNLQLARFGNYHGDGVTSDQPAYTDAIAVAEVTSGATKVTGNKISVSNGTMLLPAQVRMGNYVSLIGQGPFPTRINFADGVAGYCFLWDTLPTGQVFGTRIQDCFIGAGTNATHAIYSPGAHQFTGLERVSIGNVNQTGIELGSTGGPTRCILDDVHITAGTSASLSSRIGIILNNGSENDLRSVDVEGGVGFVFDKGIRLDFGHVAGANFHFEYAAVGLSCEQTAVGGHVVSVDGITGTSTCTTLVNIPATFVGTASLTNLVNGGANVRVANAINGDSITTDLAHYEYTTPGGAPSVIHYLFPNASATNWANKGYQAAFNCAAGRIYAMLHGFDGTTKANAIGVSYDGTGYETVFGNADTVGGTITEKLRLGRLINTSAVPLKGPTYTVATLPAVGTVGAGCRAFVSDANATMTAGIGTIVAAGGANFVPVYTDAANWRIG